MSLLPPQPDLRFTAALAADYERAEEEFIDAVANQEDDALTGRYGYCCRNLVRAAFAYFEGMIFSLKTYAALDTVENCHDLSQDDLDLCTELTYGLDDTGKVIERPLQIKFLSNVRYAFRVYETANRLLPHFDASKDWWSCLCASLKVRDRLVHPRTVEDLLVSQDEMKNLIQAKAGFDELLIECLTDDET